MTDTTPAEITPAERDTLDLALLHLDAGDMTGALSELAEHVIKAGQADYHLVSSFIAETLGRDATHTMAMQRHDRLQAALSRATHTAFQKAE